MAWQRLTTWGVLAAASCALCLWQYREYGRERQAAQHTVRRQAESVMNALVGGIRSHRRVGQFFEAQIQGVLEELVTSQDVLAAAVASPGGELLMSAGLVDQMQLLPPLEAGESWQPAGYRLVAAFRLSAEPAGGRPSGGRGGLGAGRGRGFGPWRPAEPDPPGAFGAGEPYTAILLLDRTRADEHCRRAAWSRILVAAAGNLLLLCVALAWRRTLRLAAAKGILEAEARHLQELNQAAAGLAHETRNPLGLIRGWAQRLAQADLGKAEHQQQAQSLVEECDRVASRINQFLAFARPHAPRIETLDPRVVAEELATLLEPDLDAKKLRLRRSLSAAGAAISADREMFRQALFNLIQNAVQWSPEGGTVEVALQQGHGGRWRLEVADRGPGVPPEAVSRLFSPYFTTRAGGAGLGLAMVRRVAAAHGWEAGYAPRAGGGAVFWLDGIHG